MTTMRFMAKNNNLARVIVVLWMGLSTTAGLSQDLSGSLSGQFDHPILRRYAAVIYLENMDSQPSYAVPEMNPVMDQINLRFTPHVLPVLAGSTIDFPNSDETRHNVYTSRSSACQFELGIYAEGEVKQVTCDEPGVIMVLCNVHAEMRGFVIVSPTPYVATTEQDGSFTIENILPGRYRVIFEHERLNTAPIEIQIEASKTVVASFGKLGRKRR